MEEIERVLDLVPNAVERLRALAPSPRRGSGAVA